MKYMIQITEEVKKDYFGSSFWRFKSKIRWPQGLEPLVSVAYQVGGKDAASAYIFSQEAERKEPQFYSFFWGECPQ
jgi:hypothetical protein